MIFLFPMAGESRRFREAGYDKPKFMLPLDDGFLFDRAVGGFRRYFADDEFLFIIRRDHNAEDFVRRRCAGLGIAHPSLVVLEEPTRGQAETVLLGLQAAGIDDNTPIGIFNIDSFHAFYRKPDFIGDCDGYLEVFEGEGANWSFVRADSSGRVLEVREKKPISRLCSTGLYYFRRARDFRAAFHACLRPGSAAEQREYYVAPLYNASIAAGGVVRYDLIPRDSISFCGTPAEYEKARATAVAI